IKGLSSYLLFRICPNLRKRYPRGHFWNEGYFCDGVGNSDFSGLMITSKINRCTTRRNKTNWTLSPLGLGGCHK
ncbi:MAG: transposase, partial [Nanoarchaeota archaeon]|nr:transposase [Nanoarchaeota archaeon]